MRLDGQEFVRGQYRSPERLETRISVWQPGRDGRTPQDVAVSLPAAAAPGRLLEVGCGTGALAARGRDGARHPGARRPRRDRRRPAAALPGRGRGVADLARVLRPGGRLVAITNGRGSLAELYDLAGGARRDSTFSSENGAEVLRRRFARGERHDVEVGAAFADRAAAAAYLETLERGDLASRLPADMGRLVARGATTVFAADTRA